MSALPYMPLYVADYLADTAHLTALGNGAYLMLIMNYWQRGKSLPGNADQLARIARVSRDEWDVIAADLEEFFDVVDGQWMHHRVEAELAKVRDKSAKASNAGKASAQRTFNGRSTDVQRTFNHTDTDTDTDTESKKEPRGARSLSEFDCWYRTYPHKVQRGAAEKAFPKARQLASLETLLAGVERYVASKPDDRPYQNPATWLNGKGWLDQPASPPVRAGPQSAKITSFDIGKHILSELEAADARTTAQNQGHYPPTLRISSG